MSSNPAPWLRKDRICWIHFQGEWKRGVCISRSHRRTRILNGPSFIIEWGAAIKFDKSHTWYGPVSSVRRKPIR